MSITGTGRVLPAAPAPGRPCARKPEATRVPGNTLSFAWDASTDNRWVDHYAFVGSSTAPINVTGTSISTQLPEGLHTFRVQAFDASGNASGLSPGVTVQVDTIAPVAGVPVPRLAPALTAAALGKVPVTVALSATDEQSVIGYYELEYAQTGGAWVLTSALNPATPSRTVQLTPGISYTFRSRARDATGNMSAWVTSPVHMPGASDNPSTSITYAGAWASAPSTSRWGGSSHYTTGVGASARITFAGKRNVAWVSRLGANCGIADVWLDGTKVASVDCYAAATSESWVLWQRSDLDPAVTHTLEVRATGQRNASATSARIDIDAFLTL